MARKINLDITEVESREQRLGTIIGSDLHKQPIH